MVQTNSYSSVTLVANNNYRNNSCKQNNLHSTFFFMHQGQSWQVLNIYGAPLARCMACKKDKTSPHIFTKHMIETKPRSHTKN
jgi:hypothetical protein